MQRTFLRGPSTFLFLREVQEARRCHGSASEETIAPGSPKPWGGKRQSKPETHRTSVLFLSGPEEQKLRFQARTTPLRSVVLSAPKIQKNQTMPCRAPSQHPQVSVEARTREAALRTERLQARLYSSVELPGKRMTPPLPILADVISRIFGPTTKFKPLKKPNWSSAISSMSEGVKRRSYTI